MARLFGNLVNFKPPSIAPLNYASAYRPFFSEFDQALTPTIDINQKAFDESVTAGLGGLDNFTIAFIGAALIAACFVFGLLIRIREFL